MRAKDHIVMKHKTGIVMKIECLNCSEEYSVIDPINVTDLVKIADAFARKHNECKSESHEVG